jgi:hypothetical protein
MRDFTLGIIGGCLTHQGGIAKSELYHRRLARHLEESGRARLRVRIARDFHLDYDGRLRGILSEHRLDAALVHTRSVFVRKASFFVTGVNANEYNYYINPFLFRRGRHNWLEEENEKFSHRRAILSRHIDVPQLSAPHEAYQEEGHAARVGGIAIRDLFYIAGSLVGLDAWAVRDELHSLAIVRDVCAELALPMFVLGPGRRPRNCWQDRICRKLDRRLARELQAWSIPYCGLPDVCNSSGKEVYLPDGWHLSSAGHGYVAERFARLLENWPDCRFAHQESVAADV